MAVICNAINNSNRSFPISVCQWVAHADRAEETHGTNGPAVEISSSLTKPVAHVITPLQRPLSFYDELVAAAA